MMADTPRHGKPESAPAHHPELCGLDEPGPRSICPGCRLPSPPAPGPTPTEARYVSLVRADLGRITDRFEQAGRRAQRAQTIADYDDADAERCEIAGEFWAAEEDLAQLVLMLLRIALRHQPEALRMYLADALAPELDGLADAIVRLEDCQ
jgi:hypothetical protein